MGHTRTRTFTGQTPDGVGNTIVVVGSSTEDANIDCIANGTVTYVVESTAMNVLYDTAAQAAVNLSMPSDPGRYVDPANAVWTQVIASTSANANGRETTPCFAFRIRITAGTGSVTYAIATG